MKREGDPERASGGGWGKAREQEAQQQNQTSSRETITDNFFLSHQIPGHACFVLDVAFLPAMLIYFRLLFFVTLFH